MQREKQARPAVNFGLSSPSLRAASILIGNVDSPQQKIHRFVELAIERCGSASALARRLEVSPAVVSQWRAGRKCPDAVHLIRIQELANRQSLLS